MSGISPRRFWPLSIILPVHAPNCLIPTHMAPDLPVPSKPPHKCTGAGGNFSVSCHHTLPRGNREAYKEPFVERPSSLPSGQGASSGRAASPHIPRKAGYLFQLSLIPQNLTGLFENFPIPRVANLRQEPGCPHLNSCRFLSPPRCPLSTVR